MRSYLRWFEKQRAFTTIEAWKIFKITAIAEAFGWTILIIGVAIQRYGLPGKNIAIPIAGQVHGTIFLAYFTVIFFLYPSLKWNRTKMLFALISGVIPYGSLVFEFLVSRHQTYELELNKFVGLILKDSKRVLLMQPSKGIDWSLPTIPLKKGQSELDGINNLLNTFFGNGVILAAKTQTRDRTTLFSSKNVKNIEDLVIRARQSTSPYADDFALFTYEDARELLAGFDLSGD